MSRISAVIIARNEQDCIAKCLESVRQLDEVILLDTGSTDKTVSIARKIPKVKVFFHRWEDDFSEARNRALSYATSPWVLSIDADERLISPMSDLYDFVNNNFKWNAAGILIKSGFNEFYGSRLFRKNCHWVGRIHERLNVGVQGTTDKIVLFHTPSVNHDKDPDRNIRILRDVLNEQPNSLMDMFYLGKELHRAEQYDASAYWMKQFTDRFIPSAAVNEWAFTSYISEGYYILAENYCKLKRVREAIEILTSVLNINPNMKKAAVRLHQLTKNEHWLEVAEKATDKETLIKEPA